MVKNIFLIAVVAVMALTGLVSCNTSAAGSPETPTATTTGTTVNTPTITNNEPVTILATGLQVPWALDFLPDGSIIFTERPGRVRLYQSGSGLLPEPLLKVPNVAAQGEGGLLGIAVHPDFETNQYIYLYYTVDQAGGAINRVARYVKEGNSLREDMIIIDNIPAGNIHDGGRIKFGPDGYLYVTTGDAGDQNAAQNTSVLNGKILRVTDDGSIPEDNPFSSSPVYSYGHRNPEGLAWDDEGRLWATEHGSSATDELNLIEPGKNYGWPVIRGDETREGMVTPVINSGSDAWAPSGATYREGSIFFTGLRGQSLFEAVIDGREVTLKRHLEGDYGRLREVAVGPDGFFYLLTSNRDGRGSPVAEDDRIIRLDPRGLE